MPSLNYWLIFLESIEALWVLVPMHVSGQHKRSQRQGCCFLSGRIHLPLDPLYTFKNGR